MALTCEVCGSPVRGPPNRVEIDGAVLVVCGNCAKRGVPLSPRPAAVHVALAAPRGSQGIDTGLEVDPEYASMVKQAREKLGLTHDQLGRMINAKPSVISHVETGKLKPDMVLARSLMHQLRINLLVKSSDLDSP